MMTISISVPTMGLVREFWDQTDIPLDYSVLTKLYIPPQYDQVGQGGAALHPLQGVAVVGLRPGEGLVQWTGVPLKQCTSHRATCESHIVASRFSQHQPDQSYVRRHMLQ